MSTSGDIMSTSGDIMSTSGGYHEYIGDVQYIGLFNRIRKVFTNLLPHMHHMPPMY